MSVHAHVEPRYHGKPALRQCWPPGRSSSREIAEMSAMRIVPLLSLYEIRPSASMHARVPAPPDQSLDVVALPRLDDRGAVIDSVPSDKRRQIVEGIADRVPDRMDDRACLAHRMAHGNILPVVDVLRDRMTCEDLLLCLAHLDLARGPGACGIERLTRSRIIGMSRCELRDGLVGQVERPEHQGPMTLAGNHAPQIFQKDIANFFEISSTILFFAKFRKRI